MLVVCLLPASQASKEVLLDSLVAVVVSATFTPLPPYTHHTFEKV